MIIRAKMARYGLRVWKYDLFNYVSSYTETATRHLKPIFLRKMSKSYTQPIPRHTSSYTESIPRQRLECVIHRGLIAPSCEELLHAYKAFLTKRTAKPKENEPKRKVKLRRLRSEHQKEDFAEIRILKHEAVSA